MADEKKPIRSTVYLDWVVWDCPCGSTITADGPSSGFEKWLETHRPHSSGKCLESHDPECSRVMGTVPGPAVVSLPGEAHGENQLV